MNARAVVFLLVALSELGCESSSGGGAEALRLIASANPALLAPSVPVPVVSATAPPKPIVRRPASEEALTMTSERRARIEKLHPEARGFLTAESLEEKLFALGLKRGKDAEALRALDRLAAGKWLFVSGPLSQLEQDSFQLAVRYTPRDQTDPIGLTSQWIPVTFTDVRGYRAGDYRPGESAAVLARYLGGGKATPGFDLILLDHWYPPGERP